MIRISLTSSLSFICLLLSNLSFSGASDAYFQQEVKYKIQTKLFSALNRLESTEHLVYVNHSSDSLDYLYFHLYFNRFKKSEFYGSEIPGKYGYQEIIFVKDERLRELDYEIRGTVMKVMLHQPVLPGDSVELHMRFNSILPEYGERFGYYGNHFDVGNWYPVPAVYDRFGWHADQHMDGEFYQEWGNYHVEITVPAGFVVGATGVLQNGDALPDSVEYPERRKYTSGFSDTTMVTYVFKAKNVHDFAWTADPEYVLRRKRAEGTEIIFLILSYRVKDWESQPGIAVKSLELFNRRIGKYPYETLTVADGYIRAGGIEYPNLVIINDMIDDSRELSATIIHEIAHQWFYGLLANNQTRYGWMDEGFATYYENFAMREFFGFEKEFVDSPGGFWGSLFGYWRVRDRMDRLAYLRYIRSGREEPINRHFDWFRGEPWIPYYQKMSLVISQLNYVTGDSVFQEGIHSYFREWKFRHPYPEDLFEVFEKASHRKLGWFFYEWLNTTWHCDYGIRHFGGKWTGNGSGRTFHTELEFYRTGSISMPLDFRIFFEDGRYRDYWIPLDDGMNFPPPDSGSLPAWSHIHETKKLEITLKDKPEGILLNPGGTLLDINPFNDDDSSFPRIHWYWLKRQYYFPHVDGYTATVFPFAFYNDQDGPRIGIRTRGNYIFPDYQHRFQFLFGLKSLLPAGEFWFEHPVYNLNPEIHFVTTLYYNEGRTGGGLWLQWNHDKAPETYEIIFGTQYRYLYDLDYYPYPTSRGHIAFMVAGFTRGSWKPGYLPQGWEMSLKTETSLPGSDFNFQTWQISGLMRVEFLYHQELTLSLLSAHSSGNVPLQNAYRTGGARLYDLYFNPYLRSRGILPSAWWRNGHIFQEGGGNLRSLATSWQPAEPHLLNASLSVTLGNPLNLTYTYIPYLSSMMLSVYASSTASSYRWQKYDDFLSESGFTLSLLRLPFVFSYIDIQAIHFDFPVWVNDRIDKSNMKFRWVIRFDIRSFN